MRWRGVRSREGSLRLSRRESVLQFGTSRRLSRVGRDLLLFEGLRRLRRTSPSTLRTFSVRIVRMLLDTERCAISVPDINDHRTKRGLPYSSRGLRRLELGD